MSIDSEEMPEIEAMFKCHNCGANIRVGPDDVIYTCEYCGYTASVEGNEIKAHLFLPAKTKNNIENTFRKFLDKNKGINKELINAQVIEHTLLYVPTWYAKVKADTHYTGYKTVQVPVEETKTRTNAQGQVETYTETHYETGYVPVEDEIHTDTDEKMLARKYARFYGLEEYLNSLDVSKAEPYDFEKIKPHKPIILNSEIDENEFVRAVTDRVKDRHRAQAKSGLADLFDCNTQVQVRDTKYLQTPFTLIRYKFGKDVYKVAIDTNKGKVVVGEIPITLKQRILWGIIGLVGIILSAISAQFTQIFFMGDQTVPGIVSAILTIIGFVMTFYGFKTVLQTQREKR